MKKLILASVAATAAFLATAQPPPAMSRMPTNKNAEPVKKSHPAKKPVPARKNR